MNVLTDPSVAEVDRSKSARLNRNCFCITLDRATLWAALDHEAGDSGFGDAFLKSRPHLFPTSRSSSPRPPSKRCAGLSMPLRRLKGRDSCRRRHVDLCRRSLGLDYSQIILVHPTYPRPDRNVVPLAIPSVGCWALAGGESCDDWRLGCRASRMRTLVVVRSTSPGADGSAAAGGGAAPISACPSNICLRIDRIPREPRASQDHKWLTGNPKGATASILLRN